MTTQKGRIYIQEADVLALNLPENLKTAIINLIAIRPDFENKRSGQMWVRMIMTICMHGYPGHKAEWKKLFMVQPSPFTQAKPGIVDPLNRPIKSSDLGKKDDFVAKSCEGCTRQERIEFELTGKLPARLRI